MRNNEKKLSRAKQIAADLLSRIDAGELAPGDRLPWRDQLCERYDVSQITIRAALAELAARGVVESRRRAGIYVRRKVADLASSRGAIALIASFSNDPFSGAILAGAAGAALRSGYRIVSVPTLGDPQTQALQLESAIDQYQGALVMPVHMRPSDPVPVRRALERGCKIVFVDHYLEGVDAPRSTSDNVAGGYIAAKSLLECGCERIYALTAGQYTTSARERLRGFVGALEDAGHLFDPALMRHSPLSHRDGGEALAREILAERPGGYIGLFAINDTIAAGAYVAVKQAGMRIPRDVAVVGFDDIHGAVLDPPLTSVRQDLIAMGAAAVEILCDLIQNKPAASALIPVELIARDSAPAALKEQK